MNSLDEPGMHSPECNVISESPGNPVSAGSVQRPRLYAELMDARHSYEMTEAQVAKIFTRPIFQHVIATDAFQRLKKIHFLGSLDYVVDPNGPKPNKRHTRYQHSLGVARLALQFSRDRNLTEPEETVAVISALLHDIGHAPLSHSLESVFNKEFGINHHIVSERIVRGDIPIGVTLNRVLRKSNVNAFEILATMSGKGDKPLRELFNYAINIDTIEAILRSSTYLYQNQLFRPPSDYLVALITPCDSSAEVLDTFWTLKAEVYGKLINSWTGVVADYVCQQYMRERIDLFHEDHYLHTESELREDHPKLFAVLQSLGPDSISELVPDLTTIQFVRRHFHIDRRVRLDTVFSINSRYGQSKTKEAYQIRSQA